MILILRVIYPVNEGIWNSREVRVTGTSGNTGELRSEGRTLVIVECR